MFERSILINIREHLQKSKKPLLITGARQIGKTTVVKQVCEEFENYIYINLESDVTFNKIVEESDLDFYAIMNSYALLKSVAIDESTLIVFDEIQFCNKLLTGLKYFYEAKVPNAIIATGSNLGVSFNKETEWSFPVGKVTRMKMYPMTFKEFLIATGNIKYFDVIKSGVEGGKVLDVIHTEILKLFDIYINIGGMPEAVSEYVESNDIKEVQDILKNLLVGYENDILKYTTPKLSSRIYAIYDNVDIMLNSDTQKFRITKIDARTYKDIENPLSWLIKTGLVYRCDNIESINLPLRSNCKENNFKLFFSDVGLLMNKSNYYLGPELLNNDKIYLGVVIENYFATVLASNDKELFCYKKNSTEIDFVLQHNMDVIPIEVKAGNNTMAKSLKVYMDKYSPKKAYKFSRNNFSASNNIYKYPVYSFEFVEEFDD